ncbi:MAG TPA: DUF4129 domain-containing protein [Chloroflexota bacterium]|nr:DUF4129 domain-containing protein [Chloroflexota bacterium]
MRWWAAAVLAGWLMAAQPASAGPIPSVTQYAQSVHRIRVALDHLSGSSRPPAAPVRRVQSELRALRAVRLPDGHVIRTGMPSLAGELSPDNRALRAVTVQLDNIDAALHTLPQQAANPSQLRTLDSVLREPRFHPPCAPLACLEHWIGTQIGRLRLRLGVHVHGVTVPAWLVAGAFLLLVLATAAWILRGALVRAVTAPPGAAPSGARAQDARDQADALAAAGRYRDALHYLFLATLQSLHEQSGMDLRPGLTNRELLDAALRFDPTLLAAASRRDALVDLVDEFDRAWYGHFPFDVGDYMRCVDLADRSLGASRAGAA